MTRHEAEQALDRLVMQAIDANANITVCVSSLTRAALAGQITRELLATHNRPMLAALAGSHSGGDELEQAMRVGTFDGSNQKKRAASQCPAPGDQGQKQSGGSS